MLSSLKKDCVNYGILPVSTLSILTDCLFWKASSLIFFKSLQEESVDIVKILGLHKGDSYALEYAEKIAIIKTKKKGFFVTLFVRHEIKSFNAQEHGI